MHYKPQGLIGSTLLVLSLLGLALASGLYFVRVWQPVANRPVVLSKVALIK